MVFARWTRLGRQTRVSVVQSSCFFRPKRVSPLWQSHRPTLTIELSDRGRLSMNVRHADRSMDSHYQPSSAAESEDDDARVSAAAAERSVHFSDLLLMLSR